MATTERGLLNFATQCKGPRGSRGGVAGETAGGLN